MPITYVRGDLFTSSCQTLVNTVNCVGAMGKGIARQFRDRPEWSWCYEPYRRVCAQHLLRPGMLYWVRHPRNEDRRVLCFPTKDDWRDPSQLEWIISGLQRFVATYEAKGVTSIAFPPLGCGNGGLKWDVVSPIMHRYLDPLPIRVEIYVPLERR